ncbi:helicase swr1 [Pyronema omphalodes]|nr:helicase swr1 [Pyronema omphalodes]
MRSTRRRSGDTGLQVATENGRTTPEPAAGEPSDAPLAITSDTKKSSKKRKVDASPPWKSATTQTPTAFIIDGRRKSGRTNPLPPELLSPSRKGAPTRQAAIEKEKNEKRAEKNSAASRAKSASSAKASSSKQTNGRSQAQSPTRTSSGRISKTTPTQSTVSPSSRRSAQLPLSKRPKTSTKTTPAKAAPRKLQPSPAIGVRKSARALKRAVEFADEELAGSKRRRSSSLSSDDLSCFGSDAEVDLSSVPLSKVKVKLKFGIPKAVITNPGNLPLPKPFASFEEFLNHDDPELNEDKRREAEEAALAEAKIRNKIEYEARYGLLTQENCSVFLPDKQDEPSRQYAHHDHLIAHALTFRKLMFKERKEHQELMRKRNVALMAEIKSRRPRTQEEIEQEQYIENRKLYKEQVAQMRRKWDEVTKEVDRRRITRAEEERREAGKEHLKIMLEHSTQLLDARRGDRASIASDAEDDQGADDDDEEDDKDDEEGLDASIAADSEDNLNEDNMSSESEPDADDEDDDANLTVEQLKAKYAALEASKSRHTAIGDEMDIDDLLNLNSDNEDAMSDVDMKDERPVTNGTADGEVPDLEEVDDILLDDTDESTDMDDDDDGDNASGSEEDDEEEETGLWGFYGRSAAEKATKPDEGEDEEEDDVPYEPEGSIPDVDFEDEDDDEVRLVGVDDRPIEDASTARILELKDGEELEESRSVRKATIETAVVEEQITPMDEDLPMTDVKSDAAEVDTITSPSQQDPKDSVLQSSPTTSPEDSPTSNQRASTEVPVDSTADAADATPQAQAVIKTPVPFLLRGTLREYQHYGLDWLAGLYGNHTNGILADEMGLGKTIQTIALLAHLACEKGVWGPHLIVVPTSVMLNWEMEFKKWAPGFKILTYYGSREQRAEKRKGWFDNNLWHVCITSYQLVLQDQVTFKRRAWHYLILDEAHNIKNFRSQRWQTLLNFKSEARLLLTGTPLQNNLIELWSLLYFLMPSGSSSLPAGFANLNEFQEWFAHPVEQLIEGGREGMDSEAKTTITKLHKVLRPFLLRRLKADVEKQMPGKYEHIVYCRLSKRQRYLYDDFMSMAKTRETLASGNYLSIINCLMQLRKVCNHPDLFETRQIVTSFAMPKSVVADYEVKELLIRRKLMAEDPWKPTSSSTDFLSFVGLIPAANQKLTRRNCNSIKILSSTELLQKHYETSRAEITPVPQDLNSIKGNIAYQRYQSELSSLAQLESCVRLNRIRTNYEPLYSSDLISVLSEDISPTPLRPEPRLRSRQTEWFLNRSEIIASMIPTLSERSEEMKSTITKFGCITPAVVATDMTQIALTPSGQELVRTCQAQYPVDPFHEPRIRLSIAFPDKRLLQYDCGKLQRLDALLRELQAGGHRALIFTQMTKVLDILEQFLNIHGHRYLRLDGATKVEQRQALTDRFNNDPRILVFILSTRSGGLGINLTGADTVIFYDLDWNPAMDKQCQDRCHRIGQTRDVHIYRFVSEYTIESNILRKSDQKRMLDDVVIQEGDFTTDYFNKLTIRDMLGDEVVNGLEVKDEAILPSDRGEKEKALEAAEDMEDVAAAKVAQREFQDGDTADFAESKGTPATPATPAATPSAPGPPKDGATGEGDPMAVDPTTVESTETPKAEQDWPQGLGHDIYGVGWGRIDRETEHVDEYMIRYMEWELMDVPVVIPDKSRKKRNRKGKKY